MNTLNSFVHLLIYANYTHIFIFSISELIVQVYRYYS